MIAPAYDSNEFQFLLDVALSGELDAVQRERLNTILRYSDEALRSYSEQLAVQSALAFRSTSQPFAATNPSTSMASAAKVLPMVRKSSRVLAFGQRLSANWNLPKVAAILAVAVGFYGTFALIAANMRSSKLRDNLAQNEAPVREKASATIDKTAPPAVLVSTVGGRLGETDELLAVGREFRAGEVMELSAGLAEIAFEKGARVIVQGPARLTIDSASQGRLTLGKLVAKVPPPAIGFTIETPTTRIVDLGTEFAAEVDAEGASGVHVLSGVVSVSCPDSAENPEAKPLELRAGQSVAVPQGGSLPAVASSSPPKASQFVRSLPVDDGALPTIRFERARGNNPARGVHLRLASGSTLEERGLLTDNDGALRVPNGGQTFVDLDCTERGPFVAASVNESGKIGRDGTTLYISWLAQCDRANDEAYAGLSFMLFGDQEASADERLFIGKPYQTPRLGIDLLNGEKPSLDADPLAAGQQVAPIDTSVHRFVVRIRYRPGPDDVAVFIDPADGQEPAKPNATFTWDVAFDRLRFAVGDKTSDAESACWKFDELRFGRDWGNVVTDK